MLVPNVGQININHHRVAHGGLLASRIPFMLRGKVTALNLGLVEAMLHKCQRLRDTNKLKN